MGDNRVQIGRRDINLASNNYRPSFSRYPWHQGNWGWGGGGWGPGFGWGYYGPGFGWGWGGGWRPLGWGLGAWGLGSLIYGSGYLPYYNPYYAGLGAGYGFAGYDYAQPIPVAYDTATTVAAPSPRFDDAIAAFRRSDYDTALDIVNASLTQSPDDAVLHEFRALVLFAKGDYAQAAATIHSVVALGPGWDWPTLRSLYSDAAVYTTQLRNLEEFTREHSQDAASRFLLAYHYMTGGHKDAAAAQLRRVQEIVPEDRVAADLLRMLSGPEDRSRSEFAQRPTPQPPAEATDRDRPVEVAALRGNWRAARDDGSRFELALRPDSTFTWKFSHGKSPAQEFHGKYSTDGNLLMLEREDGGSLIGEVTQRGGTDFNFRLVGSMAEDPGLDFQKA